MAEKYCRKCRTKKPVEEFSRSSRLSDGRQTYCKRCMGALNKVQYQRDPERRRKISERKIAQREYNMRGIFAWASSHPCVDCPEDDPIVLEFDHVRGVKRANVTDLAQSGAAWRTVQAEIDKCEMRCANCHRVKTAKTRGWYKYIDNPFNEPFEQ